MTMKDEKDLRTPSLNLIPKVHKLKDSSAKGRETKLKGKSLINSFRFTTSWISGMLSEYMEHIYHNFTILFQDHFRA